jgi:predicted site-specific integrase-resolvase
VLGGVGLSLLFLRVVGGNLVRRKLRLASIIKLGKVVLYASASSSSQRGELESQVKDAIIKRSCFWI